jgi:PKD domain-containing protein
MTAVAAATLGLAGPAAAADLGPGGHPLTVGVDAQGVTTVSWRAVGAMRQQAATRLPGTGAFGAPADLLDLPAGATALRMAHGGPGTAAAVWLEGPGIPHRVRAAVRPTDGAPFDAAQTLSAPARDTELPQAVVGPDGTCLVVWSQVTTGGRELRGAVRRPGAAAFEPLTAPVSGVNKENFTFRLAVDADGDVIAVWQRLATKRQLIEGARLFAGQNAFTAPRQLTSGGEHGFSPAVAVSPAGDATIAYEGRGEQDVIRAVTWPAASAGPVDRQALSDPVDQPGSPAVGVGPRGDVTVVWERAVLDAGGGGISVYVEDNIEAASRPADALSFGPRVAASPPGVGAQAPSVVVGAGGESTVAFRTGDGPNFLVARSSRPLGATEFDPPVLLSAPGANGSEPALAMNAQGDATIAWAREGIVQVETLDAGGPALEELTVPQTVAPGEPMTVSVVARDARSPETRIAWRFGDGARAEGSPATHVYDAPGTYRVRVTATDADGNSTVAERTVVAVSPGGPGDGAADPGADVTKPTLERVRLSRRRLVPAARGGFLLQRAARRRRGATLSLKASEPGTLRLTILRIAGGRRKRVRTVASASSPVARGTVRRFLSGRRARRALPRGRYRLRLVLTDAAGNASAPVTLRFLVVAGAR